jgi:hypothetical protein
MPSPNSSNRLQFKEYLRSNREKFTSGVQTCVLGDIQDSILSISSGIDTSQVTRVILFDNNEIVGLSTVLSQQQLFYVPALPDDSIIIGIGSALDNQYRLDFVGDGQGIKYGDQIFGLDDVIGLGTDVSLTVKGLGGGLFQPGNPPTYSVGTSSTSVSEGGSVSVTVNTTNVGSGTTLFYNIIGNVDSADFSDNVTAGSFIVSNGIGTVTKNIANDLDENEGIEAFAIRISIGSSTGQVVGTSSTIFITDLGLPSYTITPSAASVNEGSSVSFTVNTINSTGTLYYSTNGTANAADFTDNSLTGSFSVVSTGSTTGVGTIVRSIATDFDTESGEQFSITVRTGSTSGPGVTTSSNVTIGDVTPTINVAESSTSVNEGGSVTFTISGSNIPDGNYYYTIYEEEGTIVSSDFNTSAGFDPVNLEGLFSVNNNSGSITINISEDITSEGPDKFKIQIRTGSTSGTVIAESNAITINDTSRAPGSNANGLTFGPVQVNRDDSNPGYESDWFAICDIDTLPEGSSIALFIDTSGSMTMSTIQASYNKFVAKLNEKNITITTVTNSNEDWITPFIVDLP